MVKLHDAGFSFLNWIFSTTASRLHFIVCQAFTDWFAWKSHIRIEKKWAATRVTPLHGWPSVLLPFASSRCSCYSAGYFLIITSLTVHLVQFLTLCGGSHKPSTRLTRSVVLSGFLWHSGGCVCCGSYDPSQWMKESRGSSSCVLAWNVGHLHFL